MHESDIMRFEVRHQVHVRLEPQMKENEEALKIANCSKQQELKSQMMAAVRERVFYLTTLKHHAGIIDCFLLGIAYH